MRADETTAAALRRFYGHDGQPGTNDTHLQRELGRARDTCSELAACLEHVLREVSPYVERKYRRECSACGRARHISVRFVHRDTCWYARAKESLAMYKPRDKEAT